MNDKKKAILDRITKNSMNFFSNNPNKFLEIASLPGTIVEYGSNTAYGGRFELIAKNKGLYNYTGADVYFNTKGEMESFLVTHGIHLGLQT